MAYWKSTRHPAPSLLFIAPLLVAYEWGVYKFSTAGGTSIRNGADAWTRDGLTAIGVKHPLAAPALVIAIVSVWFWRKRSSLPKDAAGLCLGIAVESVLWALVLWAMSRAYAPTLKYLGVPFAHRPQFMSTVAVGQMVTYLGAGIYEEVIFRLVMFGGLAVIFRSLFPGWAGILVAASLSAVMFAAAHHIGPHGEPMDGFNFLFRVIAGLYFTGIFCARGFGIAVGAHACYDVMVGIAM